MVSGATHRQNRLQRLREAQGLSQAALAALVTTASGCERGSLTASVVDRWERGDVPIPHRLWGVLAGHIFGVSVDHLLGTDESGGDGGAGVRAAA